MDCLFYNKIYYICRNSLLLKGNSFTGTQNLIDVYTEMQKKYPQFTDNDLKGEMVTLYCTVSSITNFNIKNKNLVTMSSLYYY